MILKRRTSEIISAPNTTENVKSAPNTDLKKTEFKSKTLQNLLSMKKSNKKTPGYNDDKDNEEKDKFV